MRLASPAMDVDVAVIGAGFAGIAAARDLRDAGPARDRARGPRPGRRSHLVPRDARRRRLRGVRRDVLLARHPAASGRRDRALRGRGRRRRSCRSPSCSRGSAAPIAAKASARFDDAPRRRSTPRVSPTRSRRPRRRSASEDRIVARRARRARERLGRSGSGPRTEADGFPPRVHGGDGRRAARRDVGPPRAVGHGRARLRADRRVRRQSASSSPTARRACSTRWPLGSTSASGAWSRASREHDETGVRVALADGERARAPAAAVIALP